MKRAGWWAATVLLAAALAFAVVVAWVVLSGEYRREFRAWAVGGVGFAALAFVAASRRALGRDVRVVPEWVAVVIGLVFIALVLWRDIIR